MTEQNSEKNEKSSYLKDQENLSENSSFTHENAVDDYPSNGNRESEGDSEISLENIETAEIPPVSFVQTSKEDALSSKTLETENKNSKCRKTFSWLKFCEIELFLVVFGIGTSFLSSFLDNVIYHSVCLHQMEEESHKCYNLENTPNISSYNLKLRGVLDASTSHMSALLAIKKGVEFTSSVFLCPWSDSYGRKFPIIIAIIGGNFDLMTFFFYKSDFDNFFQVLYISAIVSSLFGGTVCIFAMSYSYGTDHSTTDFRTFRFATMDFSYVSGTILGAMALRNFPAGHGLLYTFLLVLSINVISAIWIFFIFEDENFDGKNEELLIKSRRLFSTKNAASNFEALWKWRRDCEGKQLRMIIFSVAPAYTVYGVAEGTVMSNSVHSSLFRDFKHYTLVVQIFGIYSCVLEFVCIIFIQFFAKLHDSTIGLIGIFSLYLPCFITAFVKRQAVLMIAFSLAALKSFTSVALRSAASKIPDVHERGRIFLFVSFSEDVALVTGKAWQLKRYFIFGKRSYPNFTSFVSCTLLVIPFCVFMFQALSIHTDQLFAKCYRTVQVPLEDIPPKVADSQEVYDS